MKYHVAFIGAEPRFNQRSATEDTESVITIGSSSSGSNVSTNDPLRRILKVAEVIALARRISVSTNDPLRRILKALQQGASVSRDTWFQPTIRYGGY